MCPLHVIFRSNKSSNKRFYLVVAVSNILLDIWVLILPIKALKDIKRPTRDKVVLFIIFGFGALSCISRLVHLYMLLFQVLIVIGLSYLCSMIRLYTIRVFTESKDKFYDSAPINIWSMIEINTAIICASVPGKSFSYLFYHITH